MVVQVVTEQLYVTDRGGGNIGVGEMAREENERNVSDVLGIHKTRNVTDFKGRFTSGIKNLGRALDGWETSRIDKFLEVPCEPDYEAMQTNIPGGKLCQRYDRSPP